MSQIFETYYEPKEYTLSKMSTEAYVRDPRFEAHGCAIKWQHNIPARWYPQGEIDHIMRTEDWSDTLMVHHHAAFDGLIESHHYNCHPKMFACTMSMSRMLRGTHHRASLEKVREFFGMPPKKTPYNLFIGKHWKELTPDVQDLMADGACDECESIWIIFNRFMRGNY